MRVLLLHPCPTKTARRCHHLHCFYFQELKSIEKMETRRVSSF
jgi:hypothetical protein